MRDVAIVGVGWYGFKPTTPEVSFREMMFEAAVRAYEDAGGIDPRSEVDAFVTCEEDFWEGISIADEFVPDPLGGTLRPTYTIPGDGLIGIASAFMKIKTGAFDVVVVESHSKASDILTYDKILHFALDPIYHRPLKFHPYHIAGLEARKYLEVSGADRSHMAMVVAKNKNNALANPMASYGAKITVEDAMDSRMVADPVSEIDIAPLVDVGIVFVLAADSIAKKLNEKPIWIKGVGWATGTPSYELKVWDEALYARIAARMAYRMAGVSDPWNAFDFAEVDDRFSYKELMHIEALGLASKGEAPKYLEDGTFHIGGGMPVNPSGGLLGLGNALEASGLVKLLMAVLQLRGEAYGFQIKDASAGVVQSWRGVPTDTGAVVVLSNEGVV